MSQGATKERLRPFKPQRFGRYTLLTPLSTGGMGEVFLATLEGAQGFEKRCVIKKILPHLAQDTGFVERFVDEARILVKLSHGNIAQVLDMGVHEGAPYIALEFIDGKDLRRVVARARERALTLPLSFILYVATRVLDALAYAHRKKGDEGKDLNLVHRDVSPQNILISYEGEVKVIDFGLAKSTLSAAHTHPSIVMGKFLYMSPEQARHQRVDKRSDLYAVGLCLYELIAGKSPFDGVAPTELMSRVAHPIIEPLSFIEPLCPPSLNDTVMKALALDPAQRFQTAEELRGRLLSILLEIDPDSGPETATRFMTEAFANEYHSERRLLAELSYQARALQEEAVPAPRTLEATSSSVTREVLAVPALTLDELPQAQVIEAPIQPLSFQPTRKGASVGSDRKSRNEEDPSTLPSIVVAGAARTTDEHQPLPEESIVLDDGLSEQADARARTLPEWRQARETGVESAPARLDPARKHRGRVQGAGIKASGRNGRVESLEAKMEPAQSATPLDTPQVRTSERAAPRKKSSSSVMVWLSLPLLAIAAVGGYIAWDLYTERLRAQQLAADALATKPVVSPTGPERSREVKVVSESPAIEADDLPSLAAKDPKRQKPATKVNEAKVSAGERAIKRMKDDLLLLTDPALNRKFTLQLLPLEKDVATRGADALFQAEVNRVHAQVKDALAKQQP
jgi:serine/threonine protein kinase